MSWQMIIGVGIVLFSIVGLSLLISDKVIENIDKTVKKSKKKED